MKIIIIIIKNNGFNSKYTLDNANNKRNKQYVEIIFINSRKNLVLS